MTEHRSQMRVVGDILFTARDQMQDEHGVGVTLLVRRANIPYTRISRILYTLVSQGLLEQTDSGGACRYKVSGIGKEFLVEYQKFNSFAEDYGMAI
ncbi:MAG: transcriptional regulator [Cenarchaeum symbiont of Oopsacas minuta]|nr:transcriptional regulator [Cenarchaeum symbiont of Oopsacas minuta]